MDYVLALAFFVAAAALISYGTWLAWHPGGYIAAGAFLMVVPVVWARGRSSRT